MNNKLQHKNRELNNYRPNGQEKNVENDVAVNEIWRDINGLRAALQSVPDIPENEILRRIVREELYRTTLTLWAELKQEVEAYCLASASALQGPHYQRLGRATSIVQIQRELEESVHQLLTGGEYASLSERKRTLAAQVKQLAAANDVAALAACRSELDEVEAQLLVENVLASPLPGAIARAEHAFSTWKRNLSKAISTIGKQEDPRWYCRALGQALVTAWNDERRNLFQTRTDLRFIERPINALQECARLVLDGSDPREKNRENLYAALMKLGREARIIKIRMAGLSSRNRQLLPLGEQVDASIEACEDAVTGVLRLGFIEDSINSAVFRKAASAAIERGTQMLQGALFDFYLENRRAAIMPTSQLAEDFWRHTAQLPEKFNMVTQFSARTGQGDSFELVDEQIATLMPALLRLSASRNSIAEQTTLLRLMIIEFYGAAVYAGHEFTSFWEAVDSVLYALNFNPENNGNVSLEHLPVIRHALLDPDAPDIEHMHEKVVNLRRHILDVLGYEKDADFAKGFLSLIKGAEDIMQRLPVDQ
jgi:hypothetical protein